MKQKTKHLQSSGETRKTNRTWHFLSTLNSLLLSKLLLLLIIPAIGSTAAWGDTTFKSDFSDFTDIDGSSAKYMWIPKTTVDAADWISANSASNASQPQKVFINPATGEQATGTTSVYYYRPKDRSGSKHLTFYLTNVTEVSFYAYNSNNSKTLKAKVNGGAEQTLATTDNSHKSIVGTISGLDANTNYTIEIYNQYSSSNASEMFIGAIKVTPGSAVSKYSVTYYGNGNTDGSVPEDDRSPYNAGTNVTVLDNTGSLVKTGYSFNGWNTAANGSGTPYAAGATISSIAANTKLYAQWTANNYAITINSNGGAGASNTTATYDSNVLPSFDAPTRSGYVLKGYYTASGTGDMVIDAEGNLVASVSGYTDGNRKWVRASATELFAQWDPVFTVTFDATTNGGTCATESLTQTTVGGSISLPNASKDGNTFDGWFTYEGESAGIGGAPYTPEDNVTLYARFTPIASGPKFSMVRAGSSNVEIAAETDHKLTDEEATITGGTVTVKNLDSSKRKYLSDGNDGDFYLGTNNLCFQIDLTTPLAQGDVISFTGYDSKELCFTTSATRNTGISSSEYSYTIPSGSPLIGKTPIYVWRVSNTTHFKNLTITSSGETPTYTVSFDMSGIADDIADMTDQETLPNPLPTPENVLDGYTFEGWYTSSTFTTRATAGATIGANTTLYANYIMDTPTITPAAGAIYAKTTMTLSSDIPFTTAYGRWKTTGEVDTKTTLTGFTPMYSGDVTDSFSGFTTATNADDPQYFSYMISDGKFYSRPATTEEYTVSNKITIAAPLSNATYIVGDPAAALTISAADTKEGATLSYQWMSSSDGSSWTNAPDPSTNPSYTPSTESDGTTYYKCIVSSTSDAAAVESNEAIITVNAAAKYTVSFDKGIGTSTPVSPITQKDNKSAITLPTPTDVGANYTFAGWYDEDNNLIGINGEYTPADNVTLYAKYKCTVTFSTVGGEGSVSAVVKGTTTAVNSGNKVLEGTEITLTATPTTVNEFESWSGNASGTTNPITIEVSDVTNVIAHFSVSEYKQLFHTDFTTSDGWASGTENVLDGTTVTSNEKTINGTKVTFVGTSKGYTLKVNTDTGKLTYGGSNMNAGEGSSNPTCHMAIHLTGVNGSITVDFGSASQKWLYALDDGNTGAITTGRQTVDPKATSFTINNLQSSNVILYLGNSGVTISELTITTPKTKLTANPGEVNLIGTASTASVRIVTNSPATPTARSSNTDVAEVSYSTSTKMLTITPKTTGSATITVSVVEKDGFPAKSIEIPVTVENPAITIKTQPTNLTCTQNDVAEKKFTVVATVNTGKDLTYQWYKCKSDKSSLELISGATSATYILNTADKAVVGSKYFFCRVTSANDSPVLTKDTEVKSVTVTALTAGKTYYANVFVGTKGNELTYTGLGDVTFKGGASEITGTKVNASITSGTLKITSKAVGEEKVELSNGTTINVTVKKHTIQLIWSAESKEYNVEDWETGRVMLTSDSNPANLPLLTRLYEDGTPYEGRVDFYLDDKSVAYFYVDEKEKDVYTQGSGGSRPTIKYGGTQGGCKFYAFIDHTWSTDAEDVKVSYDLRLTKGYSNAIPEGRKVEVQQQYTLYVPGTNNKLVTVTYGGYKYNGGKWSKGTDSWGSATNYVGKDNTIDGFLYAVRNKDNDAADEYKHALQDDDDFGNSAWYAPNEIEGVTENYQRIKPFRLPCRASYLTFTAHKTGTLTAYVYQNGIIGRGGNTNQLASGPRLGYWFDEEGWVIHPTGTVVTKQTIAADNGRDQRTYDGKNNDAQMEAYWTNKADEIVKTKLRSHWCSEENPDKDTPAEAFSNEDSKPNDSYDNPYYWGVKTELETNLAKVIPTPERPIPHQGGYMIVNEGYVKYTIPVEAGKTYYFFGKMTKVGYAGMTFVPADSENRKTSLDLAIGDNWTDMFGATGSALKDFKTTIYNEVTVPSNYRIGKWNTICLPFGVNENQLEQVFGKGTQLAIYNGMEHDAANHIYKIRYLRHVDQNILPGQPYLIYPTGKAVAERTNQENGGMAETGETIATVDVGDGDLVIGTGTSSNVRLTFKNVMIKKGVTAQRYGCDRDEDQKSGQPESYVFVGTAKPETITKYDLYYNVKTGNLSRWMKSKDGKLNTYHAFIQVNSDEMKQDAITFTFSDADVEKAWDPTTWRSEDDDVDPGEATGIVIIEDVVDGVQYGNAGRATNGKAYNMMGQQIDPTTAKGIVIINGKKVMY